MRRRDFLTTAAGAALLAARPTPVVGQAGEYTLASGPLGKTAGYAGVNPASNPRTRWWNPPSTGNIQPSIVTYGDHTIPNGEPLTLKYRVVVYDGELAGDRLDQLSSDWRSV